MFPLDEVAAVCGFDALIDGRLVEARATEREEAFARYDDALQDGHVAFLLDEERPDVFQASIGNLPAGSDAIVRIRDRLVVTPAPKAHAVRRAQPGDLGMSRKSAVPTA